MATTSTNKQPLLIDSPLLEVVGLTTSTSPLGSTEPTSSTIGVLVVDCTANDGALLDDVWLIQRRDDNVTPVNLFLSSSNQNMGLTASGGVASASFLGRLVFGASAKTGTTISWAMPRLLGPVPHAGSNEGGEPPQYRGLLVPRGKALWAAVEAGAPQADAPNLACMGGWF